MKADFHQHINENGIFPWRKCNFIRLYIKITQKGTFVTLLNWFNDILLGIYNYCRWFYMVDLNKGHRSIMTPSKWSLDRNLPSKKYINDWAQNPSNISTKVVRSESSYSLRELSTIRALICERVHQSKSKKKLNPKLEKSKI